MGPLLPLVFAPATAGAPSPEPIEVSHAERLVVVAPHPDDETLGAGGLMQRVLASGGSVRVVLVTAGDGYVEAVVHETGQPRPAPAEYVRSVASSYASGGSRISVSAIIPRAAASWGSNGRSCSPAQVQGAQRATCCDHEGELRGSRGSGSASIGIICSSLRNLPAFTPSASQRFSKLKGHVRSMLPTYAIAFRTLCRAMGVL